MSCLISNNSWYRPAECTEELPVSVSLCQANGACCGSHLQPEVCCQYLIWHHIRTFLYKASLTPGEGDNKPTVSQIFRIWKDARDQLFTRFTEYQWWRALVMRAQMSISHFPIWNLSIKNVTAVFTFSIDFSIRWAIGYWKVCLCFVSAGGRKSLVSHIGSETLKELGILFDLAYIMGRCVSSSSPALVSRSTASQITLTWHF